MAVSTVCYASREDVKSTLDFADTARSNALVDRWIQAASRQIDGDQQPGGVLKRRFYPVLATRKWDWPNFQYAYPWRLWLDQWELAAIPASVTSGGQTIPLTAINFEPVNSGPPYSSLELRRDQSYAFGVGSTPQQDIAITGPFGFWTVTDPAGTLAAAVSDTTGTAVQINDASQVGVGDVLVVDSERMLITDRSWISTGQTQQGSGCSTASTADVALQVLDGTQIHPGEVLLLDSEKLLITDLAANTATVKRAWDGSVLATHSGAAIYAARKLTVTRGEHGTTAATHSSGTAVARNRVPSLVKELAVAYASASLISAGAAWAKQWGGDGQGHAQNIGRSITDLEAAAVQSYGRKNRIRAI